MEIIIKKYNPHYIGIYIQYNINNNTHIYDINIETSTGQIVDVEKFLCKNKYNQLFHCFYSFAIYCATKNSVDKIYCVDGYEVSKAEFFLKKAQKLVES